MNLAGMDLFKLLAHKMSWLSYRQKVLSNNIAHADTPDHKVFDIAPFSYAEALGKGGFQLAQPHTATNPEATAGLAGGVSTFRNGKKPRYNVDIGNGIILEEELLKVSETQIHYSEMINLYRRHVDLLKTAIGRSNG